jgi:uncharacterized protein YbjT (DUF2867 family)
MVGAHVVRELLARRVDVEVLTRDKSKALPAGACAVIGDLLDPGTVRTVFRGKDGVFLLNAVSATEAHEGLMAVNGAAAAGVKRLVYLSVHKVDQAPHLPHFGAKICVERRSEPRGSPPRSCARTTSTRTTSGSSKRSSSTGCTRSR